MDPDLRDILIGLAMLACVFAVGFWFMDDIADLLYNWVYPEETE